MEAIFLQRINRFLGKGRLASWEEVLFHIADSWRLRELLIPGNRIWLQKVDGRERKTGYSLVGVRGLRGEMMLLNSSFHSSLVEEFLRLEGIEYQKEVKLWSSRIDFYLPREDRFVEVKGCSLFKKHWGKWVGFFPDAPTARWTRHLNELTQALKQGYKGSVWFLLMSEADEFQINSDMDPDFAKAFEEFLDEGGEVELLNIDFFLI